MIVTSGTRRIAQVGITFPDDDTCISALRRPFKPQVEAAPAATDMGNDAIALSPTPFMRHWLFDRQHNAVIVRFKEGLLWQPFRQDGAYKGIWIPLNPGEVLLGIGFDMNSVMLVAIAQRSQAWQSCEFKIFRINLKGDAERDGAVIAEGTLQVDPSKYDPLTIPVLILCGTGATDQSRIGRIAFTLPDGTMSWFRYVRGQPTEPCRVKDSGNQTLFFDLSYHVLRTFGASGQLRVYALGRRQQMMAVDVGGGTLALTAPHKTLFSPNAKLIATTTDGVTYDVTGLRHTSTLTMPAGWDLLQLTAPDKGLAWIPEEARVVKWVRSGNTITSKAVANRLSPTLHSVRHCPLSNAIFAVEITQTGAPDLLVPVLGGSRVSCTEPLDLPDATASARTVRLST